jgi:hypothetical protein
MAAGLGFKTFNTGDVLSAADVNGYLMQGVLVFASAAARDAAITSPQEGQYAYLKDTDVTYYYSGSAWVSTSGGGGGGGKVLQVVSTTYSTATTSTTNSYVDTGLTLTITPTLSTSKVLVLLTQSNQLYLPSAGGEMQGDFKILRDSTAIVTDSAVAIRAGGYLSELNLIGNFAMTYLDSPATTSATTYKTQFKNTGALGTFRVNNDTSSITLLEIGA